MSADLIAKFGKDYTVTRQSSGSYNDAGDFVPGADSTITIKASCQPVSGRERELLPEGSRQKQVWKLYTTTELHSNRGPTPTRGDIVTIKGEKFEVIDCQDQTEHGASVTSIRYYKAIAERMEVQS